jgi:hypothetical protein
MRKFLFSCTVMTAGLVFSPDAHAQTAVIDSANLAQNVQTAAQAIVAVEQLKEQLAQLEQTYQMLTNPTDILDMAAGMENQALENPMPTANALSGLVGGQTAPSGPAQSFYDQNHIYSPTDLNSATSITQVSAINGRIATESQFVEGQQAQAVNLQVLATEQSESQQQQDREQFVQGETQTAADMQAAANASGAQQ